MTYFEDWFFDSDNEIGPYGIFEISYSKININYPANGQAEKEGKITTPVSINSV